MSSGTGCRISPTIGTWSCRSWSVTSMRSANTAISRRRSDCSCWNTIAARRHRNSAANTRCHPREYFLERAYTTSSSFAHAFQASQLFWNCALALLTSPRDPSASSDRYGHRPEPAQITRHFVVMRWRPFSQSLGLHEAGTSRRASRPIEIG